MSVRSDIGPFAIVPEWLLYSGVSANAIRLFAVLHRHADKDSASCHPSRKRLASLMACSCATVDRAIEELETIGAVSTKGRTNAAGDRDTNEYVLSLVQRGVITGEETPDHRCNNGLITGDETGLITSDEGDDSHLNDSHLNERRTRAPHAPVDLFGETTEGRQHKPVTPAYIRELQAENPDVDVAAVYERASNLRRWDRYKDKRRALKAELGYERERRAQFARPASKPQAHVASFDDPDYAGNWAKARQAALG